MSEQPLKGYIERTTAFLQSLSKKTDLTAQEREELLSQVLLQVSVDMEELEVTQQELEEKDRSLEQVHRHYQQLFDLAPNAYLVTDSLGIIQETNGAAAQMLGVSQEKLRGKPLVLFLSPDARRQFFSHLAQVKDADQIRGWEARCEPRGRPPFLAAISATAWREGDTITGICWLLSDLSRTQQDQVQLQENQLVRAVLEAAPEAIVVADQGGRITFVNAKTEKVFGYARAEMLGQPVEMHP
jgi:PAS domain S-box-containing protein